MVSKLFLSFRLLYPDSYAFISCHINATPRSPNDIC
jgi:hypothetical protein